jgi:hypothetical protein
MPEETPEQHEAKIAGVIDLLSRGASYEEFPDGVTWADVAEAEPRVVRIVRAEGSGPDAR